MKGAKMCFAEIRMKSSKGAIWQKQNVTTSNGDKRKKIRINKTKLLRFSLFYTIKIGVSKSARKTVIRALRELQIFARKQKS